MGKWRLRLTKNMHAIGVRDILFLGFYLTFFNTKHANEGPLSPANVK